MKLLLLSMSVLFTLSAHAATSGVKVYTNQDESGILISGAAAETLYKSLAKEAPVLDGNYVSGKNLSCQLSAKKYTCNIGLVEGNHGGFTGEVTDIESLNE